MTRRRKVTEEEESWSVSRLVVLEIGEKEWSALRLVIEEFEWSVSRLVVMVIEEVTDWSGNMRELV